MRYFSEYFFQKITSRLQITFFSLKTCSNLCQEYMFIFSLVYPPHAHYILLHCIHFSLTKLLQTVFSVFFFVRSCRSSGVTKDQLAWCEHGGGCGSRGDREKDGRLQWCWYHQCLQVRVEVAIWTMIREFEFHVAQEFWCLAYPFSMLICKMRKFKGALSSTPYFSWCSQTSIKQLPLGSGLQTASYRLTI